MSAWLGTIVLMMLGVLVGMYWQSVVTVAAAIVLLLVLLIMIAAGAWTEAFLGWGGTGLTMAATLMVRYLLDQRGKGP